jgi:renalase
MKAEVIILGSGMAGLSCASRLAALGHRPIVLDKGRGMGGRMATRRLRLAGHDISFDHGAQYFTVRHPDFAAMVGRVAEAVAPWADGAAEPHFVGAPGMASLPKAMAAGLDVRQGIEITALERQGSRWVLHAGAQRFLAERLVITIPAPQAKALLEASGLATAPGLIASLERVEIAPCLTLMAAFPADAPRPFVSRMVETGPLAWIAQDSTKPGRHAGMTTWVAQAGPTWSAAQLDETPEAIAALMLPLLAAAIGADPDQALHAVAHRWRYARVTQPLGQPFLHDAEHQLWFGGDWCLGPRVEAAWQSGEAMARSFAGHAPART